MIHPDFIHLSLHTEYSVTDSVVRIDALCKQLKDYGMPAVAVTDQSNLFATVKFYTRALAHGIKPIIGADLWLNGRGKKGALFRVTFLCQNNVGYKNLTRLISKAYQSGQKKGTPTIEYDWIPELSQGLIVLSGGREGDLGRALLAKKTTGANELLSFWQQHFADRYYVELQRTERAGEEEYVKQAVAFAAKHNLPVVATNDVRFLHEDDFEAHEAKVCINDGYKLKDPARPRKYSSKQYLRTAAEMQELFADVPQAILNTVEIAKRCSANITLGETALPKFESKEDMPATTVLEQHAYQGLDELLARPNSSVTKENIEQYRERLAFELGVINNMGYADYFLIVADFIGWAKENGIPVGPGRGSGAGSLVAYVLKITDLDPIEHHLIFERFLNPERVSMPDFDIDFCMDGRDRVIEYVMNRYGRDKVAQIITYGTMAARAVVRDVGRVLGMGYGFVDKIAKLIPFELGITLDKALVTEDQLKIRYEEDEEIRVLIDLAKRLEGLVRNVGTHAGGVVISPSTLTDFTPTYCEAGESALITQFDKNDIEAVGLVKFDFLGLRTLTIIDWAVKTINKRNPDKEPLDITKIPVDDSKAFDIFKTCATTAVFQLESRGIKELIKRLQPDCFEDILALVALYRPGPLQSGMVDDFVNRKHGRAEIQYPHPDLEQILKPTYGVILYQEQVMEIAKVLAGYSLGAADLLRRAMGKKKPKEMAKQRKIFVNGAVERGVAEDTATYIFDLMEKFSGYGFNRSHSAAYALIAYQTAWLKAHYPAEFMSAVLSSDMDNTDKVVNLIAECASMGLKVDSPDVNSSGYKFTVIDNERLAYGLGAIKGLGEAAILAIIEARNNGGAFASFFDFCRRVDYRKVNKRVLEALVKSGSFDSVSPDRAGLMASIPKALQVADHFERNAMSGQRDLFASQPAAFDIELEQATPWPDHQRLMFEKEVLGMYLSGHPIERYLKELRCFAKHSIRDLQSGDKSSAVVAGMIDSMRSVMTKRGDRMAVISLSDDTGNIDLIVYGEIYQISYDLLEKDRLIIVEGSLDVDSFNDKPRLTARRILSLQEAREAFARYLQVELVAVDAAPDITSITDILQQHKGGSCSVRIHYQNQDARGCIKLPAEWRVHPCDELLDKLRLFLGENNASFVYASS